MRSLENLLFFILPILSIIIFIICVLLGALAYEGGNRLDLNASGYSFSNNFLSDLGRIKSISGIKNSVPYFCFNGSLIILSVIFSFFFLYLPCLYDESARVQSISRIGSSFGFLASICFAGVALTPTDLFFSSHIFFANWLYRLLCLSMFFYSFVYILMEKKNILFSIIFCLIGLVVTFKIILSDFGLANLFSEPHTIRVLAQKIASIALVIGVPMMTIYNRFRILSGEVSLYPLALKK